MRPMQAPQHGALPLHRLPTKRAHLPMPQRPPASTPPLASKHPLNSFPGLRIQGLGAGVHAGVEGLGGRNCDLELAAFGQNWGRGLGLGGGLLHGLEGGDDYLD
jgi:hypothetical protein